MKIDIAEILLREHTEGMELRSALGYSRDYDFRPAVKVINPLTGNAFSLPIEWDSHSSKYEAMAKIALVAHYGRIPAIVVTSDARSVDSTTFAKHFGLPELDGSKQSHDVFQRRYTEVLKEHGGDIGNLPRELWQESIITCIKGPEVGTHAMSSRYKEGESDRVQWLEMNVTGYHVTSSLIPDYWTEDFPKNFTVPTEVLELMKLLGSEVARRSR